MYFKDCGSGDEINSSSVIAANDGTIRVSDITTSDILFESPGRLHQQSDKHSKTVTYIKMLKRNEAVYRVCNDCEKYNLAQSIVEVFQQEFEARFLLQIDVNAWRVIPKAMAVVQTLSIMQEKLQQSPTTIPNDDLEVGNKEKIVTKSYSKKKVTTAKLDRTTKVEDREKMVKLSSPEETVLLNLRKTDSTKDETKNPVAVDALIPRSLQEYYTKLSLSPFPVALHQIICEIEIAAKLSPTKELVAQFVSEGDAFTILDPQQFQSKYLKIIGIESIERLHEELERHNFRRIQEGAGIGSYVHALFRRQFPELAKQIKPTTSEQRRRCPPIVEDV